jgi:membrane protease YdiL (CAAX protease family)
MATHVFMKKEQTTAAGLKGFVEKRPLTSFFVMAYLFSWVTVIPYILSQRGILPDTKVFAVFFAAKPFTGPALATYIICRILGGNDAWVHLKNRVRQTKADLRWYLLILLGIPAAMSLGLLIVNEGMPSFHGITSFFFVGYLIQFVIIFFFGGPLGEEVGWRGFALPRMQARIGALKASILLGALWVLWHLPDFLTVAQRGGPGSSLSLLYFNLPIFFLSGLAISIVMTWVFNHTGGSLFIAILLHTSLNAFSTVQSYLKGSKLLTETDLAFTIGFVLLALLIVVTTRGRLGYIKNS